MLIEVKKVPLVFKVCLGLQGSEHSNFQRLPD